MSKWLRRGSGQQQTPGDRTSSTAHNSNRNQFPEPSRQSERMPGGFSNGTSQHMVGYSPNHAMEEHRSKYSHQSQYSTSSGQKAYDGRRGREDPEGEQRNVSGSRQAHSSSRGSSGSQRYPQQPSGNRYSSRQGPTSAPHAMTPSTNQRFTPPAGPSSYHQQHRTHTPPPEIFPPPAVTSESPTPSEQRRPAYLLHRDLVIGKGSYGQVCIASRGEAEGHSSGRAGKRKKFACKCVMLRNDPKYISKLQEEVNVLRELRGHDNVIQLYDVFCVDNELFIITELGRGGDLFHLLTTHPKHGVTEAYAAKTVAEMLSSVAFLHSKNICHRDLKLENWVLESGKDVWSRLKLIDFGLSTHFSPGQRLSRVVGSSYYVAPEVLKKSYTEACDLWSLGVIVYMLLSGAPPFYGKNDDAIKAAIVQGEYTFPHELFRDVSDEAMAFVSTLLSYNIEYRYTAEQALTHPWLAANCEPQMLQRTKDSARGIGIINDSSRPEPMQLM